MKLPDIKPNNVLFIYTIDALETQNLINELLMLGKVVHGSYSLDSSIIYIDANGKHIYSVTRKDYESGMYANTQNSAWNHVNYTDIRDPLYNIDDMLVNLDKIGENL